MRERQDKNPKPIVPLPDTQELLIGVETPAEEGFSLEEILAEYGGRGTLPSQEAPPPADAPAAKVPPPEPPTTPQGEAPAAPAEGPAPEPPPVSMEDVVASTVDAVKSEQERRQETWRRRWEEQRRRQERPRKVREPAAQRPVPQVEAEPQPADIAAGHRRQYFACRRSLLLVLPAAVVLWLPWVLSQLGVQVPFFSDTLDNAALCVLVPQAAACALSWPVFRAALDGLREHSCTLCLLAALANLVTILDEISLLFLSQRTDAPPLGGVAVGITLFTLWGLAWYHRGMWETFRTAAMGPPGAVADLCEAGAAKGRGSLRGFYTRAAMEDTASQWQRLLLPVLAVASLVFAVLSSVGQERGQDLLWCWSVTVCAAVSLVFPLAYCVPFGRLAVRLAKGGSAVAGQYGAAVLAQARSVVVTDTDLFPPGAVALTGLKLYGEERSRALSYAATLAVQGGGTMGRIFGEQCVGEHVPLQALDHFHLHEDGGLGGMIHGETVLLGTPVFLRRQAVRLPSTLPSKTTVCLAVDGTLTAVFTVRYSVSEPVESALRALWRNGLRLTLAVRDGNITPKLLKARFGAGGGAVLPERGERLQLSDPEREAGAPNAILYREGLYPFVDLVAGSRRLCQTARVGNLLSILSGVLGVLLGFYLTFTGTYDVLTPVALMTYALLWVVPMLPLLWVVDRT